MFENPRRSRQARNFTTNVPKILDLKWSSEQIFFRKLSLGAPEYSPPGEWIMCELGVFPIFLENDLLKVDKILGKFWLKLSKFIYDKKI